MQRFMVLITGVVWLAGAGRVAGQEKTPHPALLVLSKDESALAIVNPATFEVVAKVPTGPVPHEVAVNADGKIALVTNYGAERNGTTLSVIDLDAQKEIHRVELEELRGPHGVMFWNGEFYFTAEGSNAIARYNPARNAVDWTALTSQEGTHMLVGTRDGTTIVTANIRSNSVSCIRPEAAGRRYKVQQAAVGSGPEGIDLLPGGTEIWAANSGDGTVSAVDAGSCHMIGQLDVKTQRSNRLKFTPDGKWALISDLGSGNLVVVDVASRKVAKRLAVGKSCEGILMEPDGSRAFVAASGEDQVVVIDLKTFEIQRKFGVGKNPDGMAWAQ